MKEILLILSAFDWQQQKFLTKSWPLDNSKV